MDEIQRKLALIDSQLAGRTLRSRLVSTAPLFFPAVGLIAGILLQSALPERLPGVGPTVLPWIWLGMALPAGAILFAAGIRARVRPEGVAVVASFCFLCLGAIRLLAFETPAPSDIRHSVGAERTLATIRGRILTRPYQQLQTWRFAQFASADPTTAFYLGLEAIETPSGWRPATGTIRVQVDEPAPTLAIGDQITTYCWLHRFEEPGNPGQFNVARYLRLKNVHVGASVPAREAIAVSGRRPRDVLLSLRRGFTDAATRGLLDDPPSDTPGEAILEALLLGQRHHIDPDTYEAFRRTGLLHIISLSGMHMAILVYAVWGLCKPAGLTRPARALVCIGATLIFLLVVPPQAPILRAAITIWIYCLAILFRRRGNPLNSLSLAAIVLLLIQPTQLFDVGWQLSFAATAGILVLPRRLEGWLTEVAPGWLVATNPETRRAPPGLRKLGGWTMRVLSVGVAAWLAGAGVLLYHFYNITPLASVWTAIAAVPVTVILTGGFLKIVLFFFLPTASLLLGHLLYGLAEVFLGMVRFMAWIDPSYLLIGHVPLILVLLYYVLILVAAFARPRRPVLKRVLCASLLLVLLAALGTMKWQRTHRNHLSLTCLDVGHGQAIVVRLPGTQNLLFDAGSLYSADVGTRIVVPYLDYEGLGRLHAVVVSHQDVDHINGLPEVVNRRSVDRVYFDHTSFTRSRDGETIRTLRDHLQSRRVRTERVPEAVDAGKARMRVLWPTEESMLREELGDNDKSLVCLIEYAERSILLCSDVEKPAQQEILKRYPALRVDVVVVPHHGSVRTLDPRFLKQLGAQVLLCSCGTRDYEQGRVIRSAEDGELWITARDGAVSVCIDASGVVQTSGWKQPWGWK